MTMEMKAVEKKEIAKTSGDRVTDGGLTRLRPQSFAELEHIAQILGKSDLVPKELIGKPANILLALMFGDEIGLTPAQSLQSVMLVNGRPSLFGDAVMGLVLASPVYEDSKDEFDEKTMTATFYVKRKGKDWVVRSFSMIDAAKAKLDKKSGPWQDYPKRMLFHRARSWALRDTFADILKGIRYFEEERDVIVLEQKSDKIYAMPKSIDDPEDKSQPNVVATEQPKIETKISEEESRSASKDDNFHLIDALWIESIAKTEVNNEPAFVLRTKGYAGKQDKFYSDNPKLEVVAREIVGSKKEAIKLKSIKKFDCNWVTDWTVCE